MNQLKLESPASYQIRVHGILGDDWSCRLSGMRVVSTHSTEGYPLTTLTGDLVDQAALLGVLNTLYNLHYPLQSVTCLAQDGPIESNHPF